MFSGSCLCGKVSYEADAPLPDAVACHCEMCRKQTGHFLVSFEIDQKTLRIHGEEYLKWYKSSEKARRGFCSECGSVLFFDAIFKDWIAVLCGSVTSPVKSKIGMHIYTEFKGDYYKIPDDEKQE